MIIKPGGTMDLLAQSVTDPATGGKTDLIAVMGGEPDAMFRKAIAEMGGMKSSSKQGPKWPSNRISAGTKRPNWPATPIPRRSPRS